MEENLKGKTKKGLYWSFFNQFAGYGMNFIVGIVMARLLSPSDYGITALPAVFMMVAQQLQDGGLSSALIRKPQLTEEDLATAFYYSIAVGIFLYLVLFIAAPWIADFYSTPVLVPLMRLTASGFLWGPLATPQTVILNRRLDFKTPTKVSIVNRMLGAILGIGLALLGYGLWALVISGLFGGVFYVLFNWLAVRWVPKARWSKESFRYLWNYGNKMMASSLLNTLYNNIAPIFIGKYYSPAQLGVYNRAQGYAALPSSNITGVIANVTFPVLSKLYDDDEALANNYRRMLKVSAFVIFPLMMGLSALAHPLVLALITAKWEGCIVLLQIICFSMMWYPIHAINLNLLQVKGRSDLFLRLEIIKKVVGLSILFFSLPMGLIVFCYCGIFSSVICLFINTYYTGKLINMGFLKQMKDLLPIFFLSFAMWILIHICIYFLSNVWGQLVAGIPVGAAFYLGVAYLLKFDEIKDVKYLLNRKK